jgi:hypothetical protein
MATLRVFLFRIKAAAQTLAAKLRPRRAAMIGTRPSERPFWHDPAAHARDFAERYFVPLDQYTTIRMDELGVPKGRMGTSDHDHGIEWCSFNPYEDTGGGVGAQKQINVDSGVFNPDLLTGPYGDETGGLWVSSRLRDRIDAIIAHELSEGDNSTHEAALRAASQTQMPITHRAREILRAMERGWKGPWLTSGPPL